MFTSGGKFPVLTLSYINTALSQSAFRIYKCYIIIYDPFRTSTKKILDRRISDTELRSCLFFSDLDECSTQKHDCDKHAKCMNTQPGFKCQCKPGFKEYDKGRTCKGNVVFLYLMFLHSIFLSLISLAFFSVSLYPVHSSNILKWFCCVLDLNECSNKFLCSKHAKCTNLPGSYKCECNPGYFGDGKYCNGRLRCLICFLQQWFSLFFFNSNLISIMYLLPSLRQRQMQRSQEVFGSRNMQEQNWRDFPVHL